MIEKIIDLLKIREYSFSELLYTLEIKNWKNLVKYLEKIKIISKRKKWKLVIKPAYCKKCGYVFESEIKIPSKCPRCKSEWIEEPRFKIENDKKH